MRDQLLTALRAYYVGNIEKHKIGLTTFTKK